MSNDQDMVTPEAADFLTIMAQETRLPGDWDVSGFWLAHAQKLAQFMADMRGRISLEDAAMLVGLGMLVEMARREREASAAVGDMLRGKGGAQ